MQPFMTGPAGKYYDQSLMKKAEQDEIDAYAKIAQGNAARKQDRISEGWIAEDDWMVGGDTRGYMGGGIANLKKKW
jgi:hypothetical protein